MRSDPLAQLLRQADREAGGPPPVSCDLPNRVRRLAGHKRRLLIAEGALTTSLAIVLCALIAQRHLGHRNAPATPVIAQATPSPSEKLIAIQAEIDRLRAEIASADQVSSPPSEESSAESPASDMAMASTPSVDQELERAAYLIVYQADRYHRELSMPDSAVASYRQTIELFPRTRAAQTARDRLDQLENRKEHES